MKRLAFLLFLTLSLGAAAQTEAFLAIGPQSSVKLPWGFYNLSVVDGRLCGCSDGMMLSAVMSGDFVVALEPDTLLQQADPALNYVVRNPRDQRLYYCADNGKGANCLYVHCQEKGILNGLFTKENERVIPKGWKNDISHPTFSPDGSLMIFTSQQQSAFGGYDLWCSRWDGRSWGAPFNMGSRINSKGNDIHPVFYGEYLLYASDGMAGAEGYNIYATRIRTQASSEQIIFDNYVIQQLPLPINSDADDWELAVDSAHQRGCWITTRNGKEELYGFNGRLDGIMLWGTVTDADGRPVPQADVALTRDGRTLCTAVTNAEGTYSLFVQPGQDYQLAVVKDAYYHYRRSVSMQRDDESLLIAEARFDVALQSLPLNQPILFDNLFDSNASVELSAEGIKRLTPLVNFLRDNPMLKTVLSLGCDQTTDASFNNLLTERRISAIREYMQSVLPPENVIFYSNGTREGRFAATETCKNRLTVVLSDTF